MNLYYNNYASRSFFSMGRLLSLILIGIFIFIHTPGRSQCANVALNKPATGTGPGYSGEVPARAFDGICTNAWNSGAYAPQSIQVNLQGAYTINNINLVVVMTPNGACTHYIFTAPNINGPWTPVDTITGAFTNLQHIERCYSGSPLLNVGAVMVETTASPSWVAWGEIGIFAISADTIGGAATITPSGPLTFCQGDSVKLTATAGSSYLWSTGATTQSITVRSSGTYNVTIMENSCVSGTQNICTICPGKSASVTVTVSAVPLAGVISGPLAICSGVSVQLSDTGSAGTLQWQSSADGVTFGDMPGDTSSAVNVTGVLQTTYYRVLANAGCGTDSSAVFKLTVNSLPVRVISANDSAVCAGDTAQLCATSGYARYKWSNGDTTACIAATSPGNYQVIITDVNACTDTSNYMAVTIYSPVTDTISAAANVFCFGDSARLCSQTGFAGYQWSTGDTTTCIQARQPGGYYLSAVDHNGCTAQSDTVFISVYPDPVDSIYTNESIFCSGDSTQLCAELSFFTYQWNTGDTGNCIYARQAGDYYATISDANGCTSQSNHLSVSVYPVPSVSIIVQGDTLSSFGAVSYQWYLNNEPIADATGSFYIASQPGNYSVQVTDTNGCKALSSNTYITITSILQLAEDGLLNVYPNPFTNTIFIEMNNSPGFIQNIEIYNVLGEVVINKGFAAPPGILLTMDVTALPRGVYYLRIKTSGGDFIKKMIKD